MVNRSMGSSKIQTRFQSAREIIFGPLNRLFQAVAFGQVGCNRTRKRAAGSMGVVIVNPASFKPVQVFAIKQQVVGIVNRMAAFD